MTCLDALYSRLSTDSAGVNATVSGRIYSELSPEVGQVYPQIVLSSQSAQSVESYADTASLRNEKVTVDCYAATEAAVVALAKQVGARLNGQSGAWGGAQVQGCFFEDQSQASVAIDALGIDAQLFSFEIRYDVWFVPSP